MTIKHITLTDQPIWVIGSFHDKLDKLLAIQSKVQPNDILVFLGNISYPHQSIHDVVRRVEKLTDFCRERQTYYVLGEKDISLQSKILSSNYDLYAWFKEQPLGVRFTYANSTNLLVVNGGVLPTHKDLDNLALDIELAFVGSNIETRDYHYLYDGRFGYLISAYPNCLNPNKIAPLTSPHSTHIDTQCYSTNYCLMQEFLPKGLGRAEII
jgi:hypothetical protein